MSSSDAPNNQQYTGLAHALGLYREGIGEGEYVRAIGAHTGDRYTQHSHPVPDGQDGFIRFFTAFVEAHPERDIEVVRSFQDGQYVFLHVLQVLDGGATKWVTMDIFDTDRNGRLIEHWDMIAAWSDKPSSGRTMVEGPTEVGDPHLTEANKNLVRRFATDVLVGGRHELLAGYVSESSFHQHSPAITDGFEGYQGWLAGAGANVRYKSPKLLIGQGEFVALMSQVDWNGVDTAVMDLYRVVEGQIVEHWDAIEPITPQAEWVNTGKF